MGIFLEYMSKFTKLMAVLSGDDIYVHTKNKKGKSDMIKVVHLKLHWFLH